MGILWGAASSAYNWLVNALRVCAGIIVFLVFVLIVVDVFVRLLGGKPWLYSSILVEYGLLWFTMLGAPWLVREKGHVFIDALTQLLSPEVRRVLAKFVYLLCIVAALTFAYFALLLLIDAVAENQIDTRGEDMPLWTLLLPIPICFVLVAIEFARYLFGLDSMYGDRTDAREGV